MKNYVNKLSVFGRNLQGSEIRRLFAISMKPGVISFAGGLPDPGSFPSQEVARLSQKLLSTHGEKYLQYGGSRGAAEVVDAVVKLLAAREILAHPSEIIITNGSQQAINLVASVFINPGDGVVVESPTFIGALGVFRNTNANLIGAPMDEQGIIVDQLTERLDRHKRNGRVVKLFYLIPNFQNPSGLTMSQERRIELLKVAESYDLLVFEDDPYGQLWFEGGEKTVQPIKSRDTVNRVIYTSSFSKIISPGLRLGWLVAPKEVVDRFDMAKQMLDVCTAPLMQGIAARLTMSGFLEQHIKKLRHIYKSRRDAMLAALDHYMPPGVQWTTPKGGFYVWLTLPESLDAMEMLPAALDNNVAYVIGSAFYADGGGKNTMRISFCHEEENTIEEGVKRLGKTIERFMA